MKRLLTLAALFLFMLPAYNIINAQTKDADRIIGKWYTEENKSLIEIYKKGDKYYGKMVWLKTPLNDEGKPKVDDKNPDVKLQNTPLIGLVILHDMEYDGDNEWDDGEIYDPESGNTYSCLITLTNNNQIDMRGYIGFSLFGRSTTWVRKKN